MTVTPEVRFWEGVGELGVDWALVAFLKRCVGFRGEGGYVHTVMYI